MNSLESSLTPVDDELDKLHDEVSRLADQAPSEVQRSAYTDILIIIARRQRTARKEHR